MNETRKNAYGCQKCEADMAAETVTLVGGYKTRLCLDCSNEWHELVTGQSAFDQLHQMEIKVSIILAQITHDGRDRTAQLEEVRDTSKHLSDELFALAKTWVGVACLRCLEGRV